MTKKSKRKKRDSFFDERRSYQEKNILLKGRNDERTLYWRKGSGRDERKFHENEKKERIFPIPSSTSRTLIRRSGFTLTPSNPHASSFRVVTIFFFLAYLTSLSYSSIPPSSYPYPHLSRCSQLRCLWRRTRRASRAFQIPLGTTGSAVAMPLPVERNRYTDTVKKNRMMETKGELRERERERRGIQGGREGGNTAKKSDRDEILFFVRKTRTRRRCLFCALSSIQNL